MALLVVGFGLGLHGAWIPLKAELAQWLLRDAWAAARAGAVAPKPWPWADTFPVARIEMARLDVNQIVLAGDDGRTLAFGPGWAPASSAPGQGGHSVISGHRDTHFAWLQGLRRGDVLRVEDRHGVRGYRVSETRVVDSRDTRIVLDAAGEQLTLVTCWPFDAWQAGGPERYVVTAVPIGTDSSGTDRIAASDDKAEYNETDEIRADVSETGDRPALVARSAQHRVQRATSARMRAITSW